MGVSIPDGIRESSRPKVMYLIKRRDGVSREELVAHWFANHMPAVIDRLHASADGDPARYVATLFDPNPRGEYVWDGVAQIWPPTAPPRPDAPHGEPPQDSFQQKARPYVPWITREFVVTDGSDRLPVEPLTLNAPFPTTRSGFYKVVFFVKATENADYDAFFQHWLSVHAVNVRTLMEQTGGFHYMISHSTEPRVEPYAGMAELYFPDEAHWLTFKEQLEPDGMEKWVDSMHILRARTEMIGVP